MHTLRALWNRLYVRIWLAVIMAVVVLTLLVSWAWRLTAEEPLREVHIRNGAGQVIGSGQSRLLRPPAPGLGLPMPPGGHMPRKLGRGPEFIVRMNNGEEVHVHLPRPAERSPFSNRQYGFFWLLALVGVAVALGTYPIIRQMTKRLEAVQAGVERWGAGDLSARVPVQGQDEVASLALRFNSAAERIQGLISAHKSLLANASHELRSPLTRIRMGLELMGDKPTASFKSEIARNISELDQLIDEILLASRLDAREADMGTVEHIDLTGLLAEECARAGADFSAEGSGGEPVMVKGVVKLLRRVARNLLENARRYSQGEASVTLKVSNGTVVFQVCDRGPGVPTELRERIFEPFYRLPGASEQSGGVGLGLALVKSITERHGGQVSCVGRDGGGACFVVTLPALPTIKTA